MSQHSTKSDPNDEDIGAVARTRLNSRDLRRGSKVDTD